MNEDCVYYVYERDTGFNYCKIDIEDCTTCPQYYSESDSKDDSKNCGKDRY